MEKHDGGPRKRGGNSLGVCIGVLLIGYSDSKWISSTGLDWIDRYFHLQSHHFL